jgi:hypothetical protein
MIKKTKYPTVPEKIKMFSLMKNGYSMEAIARLTGRRIYTVRACINDILTENYSHSVTSPLDELEYGRWYDLFKIVPENEITDLIVRIDLGMFLGYTVIYNEFYNQIKKIRTYEHEN